MNVVVLVLAGVATACVVGGGAYAIARVQTDPSDERGTAIAVLGFVLGIIVCLMRGAS